MVRAPVPEPLNTEPLCGGGLYTAPPGGLASNQQRALIAGRPGDSVNILIACSKHRNGCPHRKRAWSFCNCQNEEAL